MGRAADIGDLPFIAYTGGNNADHDTRKRIRSHVMKGKNLGKKLPLRRPIRRRKAALIDTNEEDRRNHKMDTPPSLPKQSGTGLSLVRFAAALDRRSTMDLLRYCELAKELLFPLEKCIAFERKTKEWFEPLTFDVAYLHATVFTIQAYFSRASGRAVSLREHSRSQEDTITSCCSEQQHFATALSLLRQRLAIGGCDSDGDRNVRSVLTDATLAVVLSLAHSACLAGEYDIARCHLVGLRKMVGIRGGLEKLRKTEKLLFHIYRADINLALHDGQDPLFTEESLTMARVLCLDPISSSENYNISLLLHVDLSLSRIWMTMHDFASRVNDAVLNHQRLSPSEQVDIMESVMYPLMYVKYASGTKDEAMRLGLLGFCASVFLQWRDVRLIHAYLNTAFMLCLRSFAHGHPECQADLWLWLLVVGGVSILEDEKGEWFETSLRDASRACNVRTWTEAKETFHRVLWIDLVFDKPAQNLCKSALLRDERPTT